MIEWSEWYTRGVPEIGDYVQVDCYRDTDMTDRRVFEGTVVRIDDAIVTLFPDPMNSILYMALRWRRGIFRDPEEQSTETEREEELV